MTALIGGLPALIGGLFGMTLFLRGGFGSVVALLVIIFALFLARWVALTLFSGAPRLSRWLIEAWALSGPILVALGVFAALYVTMRVAPERLLGARDLSPEQNKKLVEYGVGIAGTFLALLVTKDPDKGVTWPAPLFRKAAATAFTGEHKHDPVRYEAAHEDVVNSEGHYVVGWGFRARGQRSWILA